MRRRNFLSVLAGAATWPLAARAQQGERMRRIGVFVQPGDEQETTPLFVGTLAKLGWIEGRNIHIDHRTSSANPESLRTLAAELIASHPDIIFAVGVNFVAVRAQTQTIPIVFARVSAPVERGFVASLARPGGNVTGFANFAPSLAGPILFAVR
jgi:putative ABC transport system substrate-binding protein